MATATAARPKLQELTEVTLTAGCTVDRENCLIKGSKLSGLNSQNNRVYTESAATGALPRYENVPVYIDHKQGQRGYTERFGITMPGATLKKGDGIYGDIKYNPKHPHCEQILHDIESKTQAVGLSHNVVVRGHHDKGNVVVEEITKVKSIDIVSEPATTHNFTESEQLTVKELLESHKADWPDELKQLCEDVIADPILGAATTDKPEGGNADEAIKSALRTAVMAAFDDDTLDAKATLARIKQVLAAQEKLKAPEVVAVDAKAKEQLDSLQTTIEAQTKSIESLTRRDTARSVLESSGIAPRPELITELCEQKDDAAMQATVKAWPGSKKGQRRPAIQTHSAAVREQVSYPEKNEDFCRQLKRR